MATILSLQTELTELVSSVPAFAAGGFTVYDLDDLSEQTELQVFPIVGISYSGAAVVDKATGNAANPVATGAGGTAFINIQFTILLAVQYHYRGQTDSKAQALDLLDDIRKLVLGYKGVNTRPWRYIGERPEVEASGSGVIFYSQVWQTTTPVVGSFNQS